MEDVEILIRRHVDFVYAAALRQMRPDQSAAEDVTQAVLLVLMRKARSGALPEEKWMNGWLLRTTQYAAMVAKRSALRRAVHETKAAVQEDQAMASPPVEEAEIRGALDTALLQLGSLDREVILRRYLRGEPVSAVAQAVGMTENTAGRRIARALDKLRKLLTRRGVATPTAALLAVLGAETLIKAPPALAVSLTAGAGTTGIAASIAKTVFWRMLMAKVATGFTAATAAALVITAGVVAEAKLHAQTPSPTVAATAPAPFSISKETTNIIGPLHHDGTPDYVAALNERYGKGVTPQNNAFTAWLETIGAGDNVITPSVRDQILGMAGAHAPANPGQLVNFGEILKRHAIVTDPAMTKAFDEQNFSQLHAWNEKDFPLLAELVQVNTPFLDAMPAVWNRPRYWIPAVPTDGRSVTGIILPSLGQMRTAGEVLTSRAMLRLGNGDFSGFLSDITTVHHIARHVESGSTIIEELVGIALEGRASAAIGATAGSGRLTTDQCTQLAKELNDLPPLPPQTEKIDIFERWDCLDHLVLIATGKQQVLQKGMDEETYAKQFSVFDTIDREAVDWNEVMQRTNTVMDEIITSMNQPSMRAMRTQMQQTLSRYRTKSGSNLDWSRRDGESREDYTNQIARSFLGKQLADFTRANELARAAKMQEAMANTIVACAAYKAQNGKWPDTLEKLVPAYLREVPADIYAPEENAPVIYAHNSDGVFVYSVGRNGLDDDGIRDGKTRKDDIAIGLIPDASK